MKNKNEKSSQEKEVDPEAIAAKVELRAMTRFKAGLPTGLKSKKQQKHDLSCLLSDSSIHYQSDFFII